MGSVSFSLELDNLQLIFSAKGKEFTADVSGTEENPIVIEFDGMPGFEPMKTDQMISTFLAHVARPDKDKLTITISAARVKGIN